MYRTTHNLYQLVRNEQMTSQGVTEDAEVEDTNEQLNRVRISFISSLLTLKIMFYVLFK